KESKNPGFDIVIGNPPYVNTKLISKMGLTKKLEEEYGFCDDLYNHFTFRGLELLKNGGILSYITSDTFLVIMTKENMRRLFIGAGNKDGQIQFEEERLCKLLEIVNTPKAFAAMVDTAIFTLSKVKPTPKDQMNYIDLRFPKAETFGISEAEWESIKKSSENLAGWEKVLNTAFGELGRDGSKEVKWVPSHSCDDRAVLIDEHSKLTKYRTDLFLYHNSLNYSIFPPSKYNSDLFDKIVKPVWPTFKQWWPKVETSKKVEQNRTEINRYLNSLKPKSYTFLGVLADGGVGLQTGDNGKLVGVLKGTSTADNVFEARPKKLFNAIEAETSIKRAFPELKDIENIDDAKDYLRKLSELEIRELFDAIKAKFGLRILGKGFVYRIVSPKEIKDIATMTDDEKENGINSEKEVFVMYDKGDRDGNKWLSDTPYLINWNIEAVSWLKNNSGKSGAGMPVVRNPQFYFKDGLSWNIINGTRNTNNLKFKYINPSVNDVGGMKLTTSEEAKRLLTNKFLCCILNSYLNNRLTESFINFTVNFQMNDARQIPIIIPTQKE